MRILIGSVRGPNFTTRIANIDRSRITFRRLIPFSKNYTGEGRLLSKRKIFSFMFGGQFQFNFRVSDLKTKINSLAREYTKNGSRVPMNLSAEF